MNVIFEDLGAAAQPVMTLLLNSLTAKKQHDLAAKCEAGGLLELRMRVGSPALVAIWLIEGDSESLVASALARDDAH